MTTSFRKQVYASRVWHSVLYSLLAAVTVGAQTVIDGVTNSYSTFNLSGDDSLLITNAGAMAVNRVRIGNSADEGNNTAIIDGEGSWMQTGQGVTVGEATANNHMIVRGGAYYANTNHAASWELFDFVGRNAGGNSNTLLITGNGTTWTAGNRFYVGYGGGHYNSVTVDDGASMAVTVNHAGVGLASGIGNQWIVSNTSTLELANALYVGSGTAGTTAPDGNLVRIESGSVLTNTAAARPLLYFGRNNQVVFDGDGTRGYITGEIRLGHSHEDPDLATNNLLAVQNGAQFTALARVNLGYQSDSSANRILVEGTGSLLRAENIFSVGTATSSGNELRIADGGQVVVTSNHLIMGESTGGNSNRVVVTGTGSKLELLDPDSWSRFANSGSYNEVLIEQGGMISNLGTRTMFAPTSAAEHNRFVVDGAGSTHWGVSLYMADNGQNNLLLVTNQGLFRVSGAASIGYGAAAQSNLVLVTGSGSELRSGMFRLGYMGSYNETRIEEGGLLHSTDVRMGQGLAGAGHTLTGSWNRAEVTGPGSTWTNTSVFRVGQSSSHNSLIVTNSGRVHNDGILYVGEADDASSNTVLVTHGGMLNSDEVSISHAGAHGNLMTIAAGGALNAGTVTVGANGTLSLRDAASTARVADMIVANGGLLELHQGALHYDATFQVAAGGRLAGDGTIDLGSNADEAIIAGTLAPGHSAGSITFVGDLVLKDTSTVLIELGGKDVPGTDSDLVIADKITIEGGTLVFSLLEGYTLQENDVITIFDTTLGIAGAGFALIDDSAVKSASDGALAVSTTDLMTSGTVTIIPEPSTVTLLLLASAGWILRRRLRAA